MLRDAIERIEKGNRGAFLRVSVARSRRLNVTDGALDA